MLHRLRKTHDGRNSTYLSKMNHARVHNNGVGHVIVKNMINDVQESEV
ncbi:MAG: hypothetical protein ACPKQO_07850 [Nitrososphaeraceae archaeon]